MVEVVSVKMEGLATTVANLELLAKSTQKNVVRRTLRKAGEPVADTAAALAPHATGNLAFSIVVATQLTRRHKAEQRNRASEVEVYIGPAGGTGALFYASAQEFGTIVTHANPFMRPAWDAQKENVLTMIILGLGTEVDKAAKRAARKLSKLAA